jgi:membrane associated rhomboid family serine protease
MHNFRPGFNTVPPVVKNLIIINSIMLFFTFVLGLKGIDLYKILGLHYYASPDFRPYQLVTHLFMHGDILHLVFNMFSLWMFGRVLESVWGPKRFFTFYFVTGLGAAFLHTFVNFLEFQYTAAKMNPEDIQMVLSQGTEIFSQGKTFPTI